MFDLNLEDIFTKDTFDYALKRLKHTALGLDGLSMDELSTETFFAELKDEILNLSYSPQPLKRAFIPKENKDELRKLAIPSLKHKTSSLASFQSILTRAFQTAPTPTEVANHTQTPSLGQEIFA